MDVDKKVRVSPGYILSFVVIAVPTFGWMVGFDFGSGSLPDISLITLAKVGAFGGMAMFAWSLILSGRYKIFDSMFRGLDKMYTAHRFFGTLGVALLLIHPIALTLIRLPDRGIDAMRMWIAFDRTAIMLGLVSLYGLIALTAWSIAVRARHETFIKVHRLLGFTFVAGALHAFMAGSVLADNTFMYWYMLVLSAIATLTFAHYSLLSDFLHPYYKYTVSCANRVPGGVWDVRLKPKYRILNFTPGQFVYLSFEGLPEHGYHPFTIASGKRKSELQFFVKELGDLTKSFSKLEVGDRVKVKGPYGGFVFDNRKFDRQLWIAGGIGITPFLSKARSLEISKRWPQIDLIYAAKTKKEAFALKELQTVQHKCGSFNFTLVHETKFGLKSLHDLQEHFGDLSDFAIFICGPPAMLSIYTKQAEKLGLSNQIHFEEFSFS